MAVFKKVFNINNLILAFALFALIVGVRRFIEIFDDFDKLTLHKGVVQDKGIAVKYFTTRSGIIKNEKKIQFKSSTSLFSATRKIIPLQSML